MANIYKIFRPEDVSVVKQPIYESIPVTGSIVYGTYGTEPDPDNVKKYSHGMWESVYDYPYLSSSANPIFDLSTGLSTDSTLYATVTSMQEKKKNVYNTMSQILVGYDEDGNLRSFDEDGDFTTSSDKMEEAVFMNFSRLLHKDEIRKQTFSMAFNVNVAPGTLDEVIVHDASGSTDYKVNSVAGEYGILYVSGSATNLATSGAAVGLIYYQAGVVVLNRDLFMDSSGGGGGVLTTPITLQHTSGTVTFDDAIQADPIEDICDGIRERIKEFSFQNVTEINSALYFCDLAATEFNYSSNPTYLSGSKIQVKRTSRDAPVTYVTTVGLYSADNTLLAVAKLSEPLKKTPANSTKIRVRLDY